MSSGTSSNIPNGTNGSQSSFEQDELALQETINNNNLTSNTNSPVSLPDEKSQLNHIFSNRPGHLPDTPQNRERLINLANDNQKFVGKDKYGNSWNVSNTSDGQLWVRHQNGKINEGGINKVPRNWNSETGLNDNPIKRRKNK